jgi:hypothetical protein
LKSLSVFKSSIYNRQSKIALQLEGKFLFGRKFHLLSSSSHNSRRPGTPANHGPDRCAFAAAGNSPDGCAYSSPGSYLGDIVFRRGFAFEGESVRFHPIRFAANLKFRQNHGQARASFDLARSLDIRKPSNHDAAFRRKEPPADLKVVCQRGLELVPGPLLR